MTDAPERIWIAPWREGDWSEGDWDDNEGKTLNDKPCIEYVRADRIEALTKERDALVPALLDALEAALAERDDFADQIANLLPAVNREAVEQRQRAEAAEAKLAKAVEALEEIAGNGNAAGRNPQLMADKASAALAEIKG